MKQRKRLALLLIVVVAAICLSSCRMSKSQQYESTMQIAEELMLQRKYTEAAKELELFVGDQKASLLARYCLALAAGEKGEYADAVTRFQSLGDYRDSSKMFIYYTARQHEKEAGDGEHDFAEEYLSAAQKYEEIPSFRDSQERAETCYQTVYEYAKEQAGQKKFDTAEQVLLLLGRYKDSAKLAQKYRADALYEDGKADEAVRIYNTLSTEYQTHGDDYQAQYDKAAEVVRAFLTDVKENGKYTYEEDIT